MPGEMILLLESFATFVAFEGSFHSVLFLVLLQITRSSGGIVALVTLEWPLSTMCPHVCFQFSRRHANITAPVTLVCLFSSMLKPYVAF